MRRNGAHDLCSVSLCMYRIFFPLTDFHPRVTLAYLMLVLPGGVHMEEQRDAVMLSILLLLRFHIAFETDEARDDHLASNLLEFILGFSRARPAFREHHRHIVD